MRKFLVFILLISIVPACAKPQVIASPSSEPLPSSNEPLITADLAVTTSKVLQTEPPSSSAVLNTSSWLIFVSLRDDYPVLYAMKSDGSELTKLLDRISGIGHPSWSPDGKKILFHANSPLDGQWDIFVMNSDGSGVANLTNHPGADYSPTWSPDGSQIAFVSSREGNGEIYIMNSDGAEQIRLTYGSAWQTQPAWSPDGSRIAFYSIMSGFPEIYTINIDGTELAQLTNNPTLDFWPAYSPDGNLIAFVSDRDGDSDIYVMEADGSQPINLTQDGGSNLSPVFSPDGRFIAFSKSSPLDKSGIYIMNVDGSEQTRLTNTQDGDRSPAWYPSVDPGISSSLSFGPTVTVPVPTAEIKATPGDERRAQETLLAFFNHLNNGQYAEATQLYGGSYSVLIDWNPTLDPRDRVALLQHGCKMNGLMCLRVRNAKLHEQYLPSEYKFMVEFEYEDGLLFTRGSCCGANATDMPPQSQFLYTVKKNSAGQFLVQGLPVYVP